MTSCPGGRRPRAHTDIYSVAPDGTGQQQLTHVPVGATAALPSWSPTGTRIVVREQRRRQLRDLGRWTPTARHQHQITHDPAFQHLEPQLVARRQAARLRALRQAVRVPRGVRPRDRQRQRHAACTASWATTGSTCTRCSHPTASRSCSRATGAATKPRSGDRERRRHDLHRVTRAGDARVLARLVARRPSVVFTDHCCLPHSNVYSVRPDGTGLRRLTNSLPGHDNAFGSVSPTGAGSSTRAPRPTPTAAATTSSCSTPMVLTTQSCHPCDDVIVADWGPAPGTPVATAPAVTARIDDDEAATTPAANIATAAPSAYSTAPTVRLRRAASRSSTSCRSSCSPSMRTARNLRQLTHPGAGSSAATLRGRPTINQSSTRSSRARPPTHAFISCTRTAPTTTR